MPGQKRSDASTRGSRRWSREVGHCRGSQPGPLLLCIGGLHGNEPAGLHAFQGIVGTLGGEHPSLRGDLVGLAGNLTALEAGERFIDEDMNRVWSAERVAAVLDSLPHLQPRPDGSPAPPIPLIAGAEAREQRALLQAMERTFALARGPIVVLDLHTTSAPSVPFTTIGDTLANRAVALELPIPVVLGLEEQIDGAMLEYFDHRGVVGIGIEGGAHTDPLSISAHADCVWILLHALGMLHSADVPGLERRLDRLGSRSRGLPPVLDVRHRHPIVPDDRFSMEPGFRNFDAVGRGQAVAHDRRGVIAVPERGRIFLPLYQTKGDDGFFVVRAVHPAWLRLSGRLRRWRFERVARYLPGVRSDPARDDALILTGLARRRPVVGLLHLMGFTLRRQDGRMLMIRRTESEQTLRS